LSPKEKSGAANRIKKRTPGTAREIGSALSERSGKNECFGEKKGESAFPKKTVNPFPGRGNAEKVPDKKNKRVGPRIRNENNHLQQISSGWKKIASWSGKNFVWGHGKRERRTSFKWSKENGTGHPAHG